MKNKYTIIVIIILLQIMLTACEKQPISTPHNLQNKNVLTLNSTNTTPTTPQNIPNSNNSTNNNHNPFQANENTNNSLTTPAQAINQYSVSDLQMVGTMATDTQRFALIQSPDGNTCTVSIGDKIGKEGAEITNITPEEIILKITQDFNGSSYQQLIELTLNKQSAQSSSGISL